MPRYHFNVFDGVDERDRTGTELPDSMAARLEAMARSGRIIDDEARRSVLGPDWHMDVTDHVGRILFRLDFSIAEPRVIEFDDTQRK